jgi:hypothetical protein
MKAEPPSPRLVKCDRPARADTGRGLVGRRFPITTTIVACIVLVQPALGSGAAETIRACTELVNPTPLESAFP